MLASVFVGTGAGTLRADATDGEAGPAPDAEAHHVDHPLPFLPHDARQLARVGAAVQVGAGVLLALGRLPRLSSLALAATLVPTTWAEHRFWTVEDPEERAAQRLLFLQNVALTGGLLLAAADTHGKPSLAYRARGASSRTAGGAAQTVHAVASGAGDLAHGLASGAGDLAHTVASNAGDLAHTVASGAGDLAHTVASGAGGFTHTVASGAGDLARSVSAGAGDLAQGAAGRVHDATGGVRRHLR